MNKIKIGAFTFLCGALMPFANAQISIAPATLGNFTATTGNASNAQVLTLTATGPSGAIVVSAPEGFEVSKNATTGFARSITLGTPGGSIQSVYKGGFATHTGGVWSSGAQGEFPNNGAFAALKTDGSVVTWGSKYTGGNASILTALRVDHNPKLTVTEESISHKLLANITNIYSNKGAFAALKSDGSVVTWGNKMFGGNSTTVEFMRDYNYSVINITEIDNVSSSLKTNVATIYSTDEAFAALKGDGSVVTWGNALWGGNSTSVSSALSSNVTAIFSTPYSFAALKDNGSVVTWGSFSSEGNSTSVSSALSSNVTTIHSNKSAFAALKNNGSVVTWGSIEHGGNATKAQAIYVNGNETITEGASVSASISSGVVGIYSNEAAFAALKNNGSVVTWGSTEYGGNSTLAKSEYINGNEAITEIASILANISSGVVDIYSNSGAFAALKNNGSVVTWGSIEYGGNATTAQAIYVNGNETITEGASVSASISSGVVAIYSNSAAFAALKNNGSVVTWGDMLCGGNSTKSESTWSNNNQTTTEIESVAGALSSNVTAIYSNYGAFAALKNNGSVIAWGNISYGGNLTKIESNDGNSMETSVASELSSGVIAIYSSFSAFSALKNDGTVVTWGHVNFGASGAPANIGASTSGLPAQIYVRLASASQVSPVSGDLVFSSLGTEIDSRPLSGSFTGSSDAGRSSAVGGGGGGAPSGGSPAQVQKSKKGGGKSSAKKSSGSASKKSAASKSTGGKKSGGKKKKK
jgi:hypothetical protein